MAAVVAPGWAHDLLNNSKYASMLATAHAGGYDAIHIGFPCSTGALLARLFEADGDDPGPPMVRDADNPDGLPESKLHPKHVRELRNANLLLHRVVELALAARRSPARARISFEQPAVRSDRSSIAYAPDLAHHGSILATTEFKRLIKELGMEKCTFAYCRLGKELQKYTTIFYTPELGPVLDALNTADYQCNHPRGTHSARIRGRDANGEFLSKRAAAYPRELCEILARAFIRACFGSDTVPDGGVTSPPPTASTASSSDDSTSDGRRHDLPTAPIDPTSTAGGVPHASPVRSPCLSGS